LDDWGDLFLILSADLGMHVVEDAFGCDVEALWSMPLSLAAAKPAAKSPALSMAGSMSWAVRGVEPGLS